MNTYIDPGASTTGINATGATPAAAAAPIPDMAEIFQAIPPSGTGNFTFTTAVTSPATVLSDPASFTPGTFTLPLTVRINFFGFYGVTGNMVCVPSTTPNIGTVTVDPANGSYRGITPTRLLDTRAAVPCVSGSAGRNLTVAGTASVPSVAAAVALNVTATRATAGGYVTVSPTGVTRPKASNLNYLTGQTIPNMVIAKVGAGGQINLYASAGCPDLIVDVVGWFEGGTPANGGMGALTPARALDTRTATPCVSGAGGRNLTVAGVAGVPAGAGAVALNVTATRATTGGYITVSPAGVTRPTASNLNYLAGQTIPNMVIAKVGAGGQINLYASAGCPHLIVDVVGWFESSTALDGGFSAKTPARLLDTRRTGPCVSGSAGRNLTVAGVSGIPSNAAAVALNVTATRSTASGYVTVSPTGVTRPTASNLNYLAAQTIPNMVIAKVGAEGQINLYASAGCPDLIVDVVGYFTPSNF